MSRRPRGSVRVRSLSFCQSEILIFFLGALLAIDLVLTASGLLVWTDSQSARTTMPLTLALGTTLGWVLFALLSTLVWQAILQRLRDPGRHCRRVLHVCGTTTAEQRRAVRRRFSFWQWRVQFDPEILHPCAVSIALVESSRSQAHDLDAAWPLKVSLEDLEDSAVRDRIERRSDIQARRRIIGGLERIFKAAHRRKYRNGHGFLLAPHLPLWYGLRRDEPEPEPGPFESHMVVESIGPPYHRAFPRLARFVANRMLRSLQIDLVFVEDAVTFRRFSRVMRRLFELYDKHDGRRPADDRDFLGLPGTRVLIYDMQFDNPFESSVYPEPKFVSLGRARVLLVFRDRSEEEELIEPPFDSSRTPAPLGLGR